MGQPSPQKQALALSEGYETLVVGFGAAKRHGSRIGLHDDGGHSHRERGEPQDRNARHMGQMPAAPPDDRQQAQPPATVSE